MLSVRAGAALVAACGFLSGCGKGGEPAPAKQTAAPPANPDAGPVAAAPTPEAPPEVALDAPPVLREHGQPGHENYSAGDKTTAFGHGRLAMALPGVWTVKGDSQGTMQAVPDELKDTALLLAGATSAGGKPIDEFLSARIDDLGKANQILERTPAKIAVAKTKSGVPFAVQVVRAKLGDGTELYFTVVGFDVGGGEAQPMLLVAANLDKLKRLTKLVGPALAGVTVKAAPVVASGSEPPSASTGKPEGEGGSVFKDTGSGTISGVWAPDSPKLPAIGFDIKYNLRLDVLSPEYLNVTRDAAGNLYVNYSEQISDNSPIADNIFAFPPDGRAKPTKTSIGDAAIQTAAKKAWNMGVEVMYLGGFSMDGKGNVLVRAQLYFSDWEAFFWFGADGSTEGAVSPTYIGKLTNGTDWSGEATTRLNEDGTFWLLVRYEDTKLKMGLVARRENGNWATAPFTPQFSDKYPKPDVRAIADGNPDYKGDWTFFSNGVVWEIDRKGYTRPLARVDISAEGVTFDGPVVLKNGDIWLAVNQVIDSTIIVKVDPYTGVPQTTSGSYYVGDRSRLIRFRKGGKTGLVAAEIDGMDVLATLIKGGAKVPYENLFRMEHLQVDPATGGLLGIETRNSQVVVIVPKD